MSSVLLSLPNRSITVTKRPIAAPAGFLFTVLILGALFIGMTWWQGPGLWRDWQISQNPLTLRNGDVQDGECSTRRGLTDCEARLVYQYNGVDYDKQVTLAFFDPFSGDYEVDLVISRDNPDLATLSLGLDMLWNRLITFGIFALLFGGGAIGMIIGFFRTLSANRAATTAGRLTVVPVELVEWRNGFASYVDYPKGPRSKRTTRTKFAKGQAPLLAIDEEGNQVALAVKADHVGLPILLDTNLERLDLTDIERQAALAGFDAEQQRRGGVAEAALAERARKDARTNGPQWVRGLMAGGGVLVLAVLGAFGYWIYYTTSAANAFDDIGMEINNIMPEPLNNWGCEQLYARFGDSNAPYGCAGDDYVSWKVAPAGTKSKISQ